MSLFKAIILAALAGVMLSGCASMSATEGPQAINDPFEGFNRVSFDTTLALDKALMRPTAVAYRQVFPAFLRDSIRNFLNNLDSPIILANDVLQGEVNRAGDTLIRAGVNSTLGIGGLVDVAKRWGYMRHSGDFGQTLAVYGVGEGRCLFVPLLGPGNPVDVVGCAVSLAFSPLTYGQYQ